MILSGHEIAATLQQEMKATISTLVRPPGLAVILVGNHPSSSAYVKMKQRACANVGINTFFHHLDDTLSEETLLDLIADLNSDPQVDGILVQLPLPKQIHSQTVMEAIDPHKDVDGFHPVNMGKLLLGLQGGYTPCTPLGIKTLLERYQIKVQGKHVVIVGRSNIVGKPLAALLMQSAPGCNGTVTVIHSQTPDLETYTLQADILVAAIGKPTFIKASMVKEGAVVIDVGINRVIDSSHPSGYRMVGDVAFQEVSKKCSAITPVPRGIGPMTVAMLLHNTLLSYQRKNA